MSKNFMMVIGVLLIAVFALSACQSGDASETPGGVEAPVEGETPPPQETLVDGEPTAAGTPAEVPPATANDPVNIVFWTKEGNTDWGMQYLNELADAYTAQHPNVTFLIDHKEVETLREDFLNASASNAPDLLWTVSDHAGLFKEAGLIQPVQDLFDMEQYITSVILGDNTWGVPVSSGNHLMLIYNRSLIEEPPQDTNELIESGQNLLEGENYALVFNQTEPFWLVPWLGGFGGSVFAEDGVTPTLDTPEMVATLEFLRSIKFDNLLVPAESDYDGADTLFRDGQAAMIINGDWSLGDYREITR
jgi:arabinogalactan oligomer / maltooligosaccharide transport system substrate-binding protein